MIKKFLFITLFVLTFFLNVKSQIDTSFWFVAPDISQGLGDRPIFLYFNTYAQAATVKVSQPANGAFVPITKVIPANSIDSVNLTAFIASIENSTANTVLNNGLYISSTQKISALYAIKGTNNKEQYSLKGPKALGVDFYVPMQEFWNQAPATTPKSFSSIDIVASQNSTTVLITPKTNIIGHAANASYTISLQKGQTYSCQDTARSATTSLAGSIISSNNPIAISIQSSGLSQSGCLSSVGDQITSSTYIGTDYIVNKGTTSTEKIFVLATQNNTQITINDGSTTTHVSNFGENFIYTAAQNITYVNANKPVYVLHVSGYGCKLSGAQLPPFFCAGTYTTAFTRTSSDSLALNIFTRTGFEGNFALNGSAALIPASAFTVVPGTSGNIKSARLYYNTTTIPVGSHNVVTNTGDVFGMGSVNGSSVRGSSYAYLSEFTSYPSINAGSDFTICANSNVALNGQIGGGNVTGTWSTNGFGTFNAGFTALTNTYTPSQLDTTVKPVKIFLTSSGPCAQKKDTLLISVKPSPLVNASVDQIVCGNNSSVLLAGTVTGGSSTGIWSSTGSGTFTPNNTTLSSTYLPSSADTAAGSVKLVLTSTTNGICPLARDTMKVTITDVPTANAGPATVSVCANNPNVTLSGTIGGTSSTGKWTSTGTGNFSPSNIQLNTGYIPSTADVLAGQVKLYLTSTSNGLCSAAKDSIIVVFTSSPNVNAGTDLYICKNNPATVLSGTVSGATTTGIWSGGTGTFNPNNTVLTATYTPSAAELAAGLVNLSLTSTSNGSCNSVNDQVLIVFNNAPTVNAGLDVSSCKNNAATALSGVVSGTTTTGIWTGGAGTFSPSNTNLNATYTPNAAELAAGSVTLTLTSTSNANCNAVTDNMIINFTPSPVVNAGVDLSVCQNNPLAVLSGSVSGGSTTGIWSGGNGTFNPSNSVLTASYTPSASELSAGSVTLTLTSTSNGNCNAVSDNMVLVFTPAPVVNAGSNLSSCKNNPATVLSGTVSGATTTGIWSGGTGTFNPSNTALTTTYTPSAAELSAGTVNLILSSTGNGNCSQVSDNVLIVFTNPPSVNAGVDLSVCKNNPTAVLSGIVSGTTTTGIWTGGAGAFSPSNTNLNATYTPNAAELAAGSVTLTLTSTSNANCNAVTDNMIINFTPSPVVNTGIDLSVCQNNAVAILSGSVSGGSTTGIWSGGNGTFNPSNSVLTASYTPSASELSAGSVTLTLTSTSNGNCNAVTDNMVLVFTPAPVVNAGANLSSCKNNPATVLSGTVSGATTTGIWSGGTGTFNPSNTALTTTYTPSAAELSAGTVNLILSSTGNGNCSQVSDNVLIVFTNPPSVNAGVDLSICKNNPTSTLSGGVSGITTTGIWTGGAGAFSPSNTNLNATYTPNAAELAAGSVTLTLTSTSNANCNAVTDNMIINFTPSPVVNAGVDLSVCQNNAVAVLSGSVSGGSTTGIWSGGNGTFNPSNSVLTASYTPSASELSAGSVTLTLTSTSNGNCNAVTDNMVLVFTPAPVVNAGSNLSSCKNNPATVLSGTVSGATTTGIWSGGTGTFNPSNTALTVTYTPSAAELSAGTVNLILSSTGNGNCNQVSDNVLIVFTNPPSVNAGVDLSVCKNNPTAVLSGIVSGTTTTGIWTGGAGAFSPSNTNLNATYTPNAAELAAGSVTLTLTSTSNANCNAVTDNMIINFTPSPVVNAGVDLSVCQNNAVAVLSGSVSGGSTTGIWSGGNGTFNPSNSVLTASYTPSASELSAGSVTLTLTSTNNGNCNQVTDDLVINFTPSPIVNAGANITICKNNPSAVLTGSVSGGSTTGIWTGGAGTFNPSNTDLNATYIPTASELTSGSINLVLSSTTNGNCNQVSDNVLIIFTNPPSVNAGVDLNTCKNNPTSILSGVVSGTTTTGIWSGGSGTFSPSNTSLNATYNPSPSDLSAGTVTLTLTSTNNANCNAVTDNMIINFTPSPVVNAGVDFSICRNNPSSVLSGSVSGGTTSGIWSGGLGIFNPSNSVLTATYTPNSTELTAGTATLILSSTNNGNCLQVRDTVIVSFSPAPIVNAGANLTICKNNPNSVLTGSVSGGTTTGIWTGGSGTFNPSNTALNATYIPSGSDLAAGSVNLVLSSTNNGNCNQVTDNVLIVFTNPPSVNAGVDLITCKNNAYSALTGFISGPTTTGIWTGGTGVFSPTNTALTSTYTPSAGDLANGFVTLYLTSTNNSNCNQVVDSLKITYTNAPTVSAGLDVFACKNNAFANLSGIVSGPTTTGIWTGGSGSYNPSNTALTTTYTPNATELAAGSVTLVLNSTNNGNCIQNRDTVVINFTNPATVNAGVDLYSCKNNASTLLSGVVGGPTTTGIWTGGTGTFNPNNTDLNATYIPSAAEVSVGFVNLTLTSTNNGNCLAISDLIKLNFLPKPFANFNFNNVCLNNTTTYSDFSLAGIGTITDWEWSFGDNSTSTSQNPSHTFTTSGTYTTQLVVKNSFGCYDTIKKSPTIYPLPQANFGISRVCNGDILNLNFSDSSTVSSPEIVNQWNWYISLPGGVQSNLQNPSQLFPGSGLYNIRLIALSNHNCRDTIEKQVNITPRPSAGFSYSVSTGINVGTTVSFVDTSSYSTGWSWNFGNQNNPGTTQQNPSTIYFENGLFIVTQVVSDDYGCTDTAKVAIRINNVTSEISTLIPNAISPNGDGKNDVWKLDFLQLLYPDVEIDIYNRWGENIFNSKGYETPWDGTYNGSLLPVGTYYYVINLNDSTIKEPLKGGILLIR